MPPFPLCCLAGLWSTEAAAAFAAMSSGLAAGAAANTACTVTPQYKGAPRWCTDCYDKATAAAAGQPGMRSSLEACASSEPRVALATCADGATPVADLVAAHQKQQGRVERMQQPLVVLGVAAAAAAASSTARSGSHAAAPLAISAAVSAGTIVSPCHAACRLELRSA